MKTIYIIRESEAGNKISIHNSESKAEKELREYENTDRKEGIYTPDSYEIVEYEKISIAEIVENWLWFDDSDNVFRLQEQFESLTHTLPAGMDFTTKSDLKETLKGKKWFKR